MRARDLARMAAVAAPRPDAEPVTIAHRPSFDMAFPLLSSALPRTVAIYHTTAPLETPLRGITRTPPAHRCIPLPQTTSACHACTFSPIMARNQIALEERRG